MFHWALLVANSTKAPNISLRLDLDTYAQIYDRHIISGRSLNKEVAHIIRWALAEQVKRDKEVVDFMLSRQSRKSQERTEADECPSDT